MKDNLKDDILNVCRGYERDHIIDVLHEIVTENSAKSLRNLFNMQPCPSCGSTEVHITNVMQGVTQGRPKTVAKMGFCTACKFYSKKVYKRDLREPITEAIWTKKTVDIWNATHVTSLFSICEELFGVDYQYSLNSEEVCELITALSKYGSTTSRCRRFDRAEKSKDDEAIVSEMADVIICIFQLLYSRRIPFTTLNEQLLEKLTNLSCHESVRTAIVELSNKVTRVTRYTNASTVEDDSVKP